MACLQLRTGANAGRCYQLGVGATVIGRDRYPLCDVVIRDPTVSRRHAQVNHLADGYYVEDLGSLNGTRVNGQKITGRTRLKEGDVVELYETVLVFHDDNCPCKKSETGDIVELSGTANHTEAPSDVVASAGRVLPALREAGENPATTALQTKLRAVLEIHRSLGNTLAVDTMLENLLERLFEVFPQTDRGYILLADPDEEQLTPRARKESAASGGGSALATMGPINRRLTQRVFARAEAVLSDDRGGDEATVFDLHHRSAMCAPLIGPSHRPLGVIYLDTNDPQLRFTGDDLDVLLNVATISAQALEFAQLHADSLRRQRRDQEMATAREVQLQFLPRRRPVVRGYRFYHHYRSAREIGGDYLGYVPLPDGRVAFAVGDVAGKGVSAALLMARFCSDVRYCLATTPNPVEAVRKLNEELAEMPLEDRFVTFLLGVLDPQRHLVSLVSAGHIPPLMRIASSGEVHVIAPLEFGYPLGVDPDSVFAQTEITMQPQDMLLLYTDGVSEAMNPDEEIFGHERVRHALAEGPRDAVEMVHWILGNLQQFTRARSQNDDICLLLLQRT